MLASSPERAALSRDLADFLIDLSIALHKHAMYPEGHPSLAPAAGAVTRRAELLLEHRASLALGVARNQLVIDGVATDSKHPVLRELAERLHRHHLGAVTFRRDLSVEEVAGMLKLLAVEAERSGQPLGLGPPERLRAWAHVELHPLSYERLELVAEGEAPPAPDEVRAAQLWVGLARAALALQAEDAHPTPNDPAVVAQAIDERTRGDSGAYDQVIVGYLLQIAEELKGAGGPESVTLRRRLSRLVGTLKPETLRRLVEMGGDFAQRRQFVADATAGMAADAVLEIFKAAAETSQQTISHSLVRLLSKLAAHADTGASDFQAEADAALRDQVRRLVQGWTLADPNPAAYASALARMARAAPPVASADAVYPVEPDRVVSMALELQAVGPATLSAVDRMIAEGRLTQLLDTLDQLPAASPSAAAVWAQVATADVLGTVLAREPVDFGLLDRLARRIGVPAAAPLLDALATAESRGVRRGLLGQLARMGAAIGPVVVSRLDDERWYVTRNLLALLEELPSLPAGFSPARFTGHADPRVRWQAVKLQLKMPAERDDALVTALADQDPRTLRLALGLAVALQSCPDPAVPLVVRLATDRNLATDLRVLAIRVLGTTDQPAALEALLQLTSAGRTWFGRDRLPPKSPEVLAALAALATGWRGDAGARDRLAHAAASRDPVLRAAVGFQDER